MFYLDFDLEIGQGLGGAYPITVRSPAGQTHQTIRFPFDEQTLEKHLLKLQIALLQSATPVRQMLSPEQQLVQDFGQQLFDAIISGEARSRYDVCRQIANQQSGEAGVRLRLNVQAPELTALPWELLYDARQGEYVCLSRFTPLVRYLGLSQPTQPLAVNSPLRILCMIADPSDQARLDIQREKQRISSALGALETQGLVELHWLAGQTWNDLHEAMWRGPWHIFHFIGHGGFNPAMQEGVLALANEQGKTQLLSATQLTRLLADHRSLRLALLNACEGARGGEKDIFSSTAATLAHGGIPAVLAMQHAITDRAAIQLTRTFYNALANGLPVDQAVAEVRKAISVDAPNTLEWGTPVLYMRAPDGVLFTLEKSPLPEQAPKEPPHVPVEPPRSAEVISGVFPSPPQDKESLLQAADREAQAGRSKEALAAYDAVIRLDRTDARAYRRIGYLLKQLKRNSEALAMLEEAIRLDPSQARAHLARGEALRELSKPAEALTAYDRALVLDARLTDAYVGKGNALCDLKQYVQAITAYDQALTLDPHHLQASAGRTLAHLGLQSPHMTQADQPPPAPVSSQNTAPNIPPKPILPPPTLPGSILPAPEQQHEDLRQSRQPPNIPAPTPRRRPVGLVAALSVLLVILVVGSSLGVLGTKHLGPLAALFGARATSTATAATAPAMATATTAEQMYARATSGAPVIDDSLIDNSRGYNWITGPLGNGTTIGTCTFSGGAYHLTAFQGYWIVCGPASILNAPNTLSDFAFQVQMNITTGDTGGIAFRTSPNGGYFFYLYSEGFYTLFSHDPVSSSGTSRILLQGFSSAIRTGLNHSNLIAVLAQGNSIMVFVNNQYIGRVIDNSYSKGFVGVSAYAPTLSTDVQYSNAKLWA